MQAQRLATIVAAAAVLSLLGWAPGQAQPRLTSGDAGNGQKIAERLCASCHSLTTPPAGVSASSDVMSFPAIARQPRTTAEYLAGRIIIPHPAMPDTALNIGEIRDVIAYILSFKTAAKK